MKKKFLISLLIHSFEVTFITNGYNFAARFPKSLPVMILSFILINLFAGTLLPYVKDRRQRVCRHGTVLLYSFYVSILVSTVWQIVFAVRSQPENYMACIWSLVVCIAANLIVFWNGIICVYLTSTQLGLKWRIIGILCGMIPIVNLIVLFVILKTTTGEFLFEAEKTEVNRQRKAQQVCATKYPILLVHGVFFRDSKFFNYWGRIPQELEANGARIFYGNHGSAASITDSAAELKARIAEILAETGAEKLNIIAHSKGGLDCRYAISRLDIGGNVASLTTINTPHRGCLFADYLLTQIPAEIKNKVADTYNSTLKKLGDPNPDFLAAVGDLTDAGCSSIFAGMPEPDGIFCQSVGSVIPKAANGKFPLNFSYHLVKYFSGENDGLVSEDSFRWGEKYTLLRPTAGDGISHGDVIDLNRLNLRGFDVREFYVNLVHDLKCRGL